MKREKNANWFLKTFFTEIELAILFISKIKMGEEKWMNEKKIRKMMWANKYFTLNRTFDIMTEINKKSIFSKENLSAQCVLCD